MDIQHLTQLAEAAVNKEKQILVNQMEDLEEEREQNEFLKEIAHDYKRYKNAIINQKKNQQRQLLKILNYLDQIMETNAVTKYTLSHTYNEQKRLVNEIKQIQRDMDNILLE